LHYAKSRENFGTHTFAALLPRCCRLKERDEMNEESLVKACFHAFNAKQAMLSSQAVSGNPLAAFNNLLNILLTG